MNTDIRIDIGFWTHPKTGKLIRVLGLDGVRSLQILWIWTASNRPDGYLKNMSADDIEYSADWRGATGDFFKAIEGDWLDKDDDGDGFKLHNWKKRNPWVAECDERSGAARLSRLCRKNPKKGRELRGLGIKTITRDEYYLYEKDTTVQRPYNECSTIDPQQRTTPVPDPVPDPEPKERVFRNTVDKKRPRALKVFTKPDIDEIRAYCLERKNNVDPNLWLDHYISNDWKVGKNAMKDWKAAVRTWEKSSFRDTQKKGAVNYQQKCAKELLCGGETNEIATA